MRGLLRDGDHFMDTEFGWVIIHGVLSGRAVAKISPQAFFEAFLHGGGGVGSVRSFQIEICALGQNILY